jgi:CcmD family protein
MSITRAILVCLVVACLAAASGPFVAAAQPSAPASSQPAPQDQFVPVKDLPAQEQLPAPGLVMTAYGFVWAVLLVYLWTIWRRLMKVEREMHDLTARLGEKR